MKLLHALGQSDLIIGAALGSARDFLTLSLERSLGAVSKLFWQRVNYRYASHIFSAFKSIAFALNPASLSDNVAQANASFLLGAKMRRNHNRKLLIRKDCLEKSAYHCEPGLIEHIRDCGKVLRDYVSEFAPGRPVIFAPVHTVSDRIAAVVCSLGPAGQATVVSAYAADVLGKDEMDVFAAVGGRMDRLTTANLRGTELRHHLRALTDGRAHLVVFPDALPEFTSALAGRSMRTKRVEIFGRPGRLHSGLEVLSRASRAVVVYFALYEARGRLSIDILSSLNWNEIESSEASIIEVAIRKHWRVWLLWRCRSLFYMNPETAYE